MNTYAFTGGGGGAHSVTNDASGDDGPGGLKVYGIVAVAALAAYRWFL